MTIDELVAKQEIHDVLIRYTRGIDRMDRDLVRSCYHPDAHDDHGPFKGSVDEFLDWVEQALSYFSSTMHFIGNQLIDVEVDGDVAHAESYCVAYHRRAATNDEPGHDLVMGLRYVDRLEKRLGEWRIADRLCVFDWSRRDEIAGEWDMGPEVVRGTRGDTDPVFRARDSS